MAVTRVHLRPQDNAAQAEVQALTNDDWCLAAARALRGATLVTEGIANPK